MDLTLPVGRVIGGSLYKLYPLKDNRGNPRLKQDGTPLEQISFGVAIKKDAEQHWNQTPWGKQIHDMALAAWPNGETQQPAFSWKITDGDSQIPNKAMKKPCEQAGYPGNWVIWFSQSWSPTVCNADGTQILTEPNAILPGYWVQVMVDCSSNNAKPGNTAGIYMNPKAVALTAYDTLIESQGTVDVSTAGFGNQALPEGASITPVAQMPAPAPVAGTAPPVQNVTPAPAPAPAPDFAAGPPPVQHQMTAMANGATYESMIATGWTDDLLRQNGMML